MSKTYLERKHPDGSYIFISYSHLDTEAVDEFLTELNAGGADFWYDSKLKTGADWEEKVKEVTSNKNCVGIIYFISSNFIKSEACKTEFEMYESLKASHKKFGSACVLLADEDPQNYKNFLNGVMSDFSEAGVDIAFTLSMISFYQQNFNADKIYLTSSYDNLSSSANVSKLLNDVFAGWGCLSEETDKIDALFEDGLVDKNYRLNISCQILENVVNRKNVSWKVFAYSGDTISAILVSDELFASTCLSLARKAMDKINAHVNISDDAEAGAQANVKHLYFQDGFCYCLKGGESGEKVRFLRAIEHERHYPQIKEVLEKVPVNDSADDGYFFVQDDKGNVLFADRGSDDVYRHIKIDAYASLIPVIDIDYQKYKEFLNKSNG